VHSGGLAFCSFCFVYFVWLFVIFVSFVSRTGSSWAVLVVCHHAAANFSTVLKLKTSTSDLNWKKGKKSKKSLLGQKL